MTPEARLRKGLSLTTTEVSTWPWRLKVPKKPITGTINNSKVLEEVLGKNEDWSHLSKRRQAKRVEKIEKDINWAKRLLDIKMQGVVEKARELEKMQALHAIEAKAEKVLALEAPKLGELPRPPSSNDSA
jgi:ATP-dependent Lon protease